jgi:hypothetical protein
MAGARPWNDGKTVGGGFFVAGYHCSKSLWVIGTGGNKSLASAAPSFPTPSLE